MKRIRVGVGVMMLVGVLIVACQADQSGEQDEPTVLPSIEASLTLTATSTDAPSITPTRPTRTPAPTITMIPPTAPTAPSVTLDPPPIELPASLLWTSNDRGMGGLWLLDGTPEPQRLAFAENGLAYLSPDGTQVLVGNDSTAWVVDLATREQYSLPHAPNLYETFQWWPYHEGFIGTSVRRNDTSMCYSGYLTHFSGDDPFDCTLLDEEIPVRLGNLAVSPDGSTIAYVGAADPCIGEGFLRLYREGQPLEDITPASIGIEGHHITGISWSPDGTKLGLVTRKNNPPSEQLREYIVVLDLAQRTTQILREFDKFTTGSDADFVPVWSPSGDWLVFHTIEKIDDEIDFALWYADASGVRRLTPSVDSHLYANQGYPSITPDGAWIAMSGQNGITFIRMSDRAVFRWEMPATPFQLIWIPQP